LKVVRSSDLVSYCAKGARILGEGKFMVLTYLHGFSLDSWSQIGRSCRGKGASRGIMSFESILEELYVYFC